MRVNEEDGPYYMTETVKESKKYDENDGSTKEVDLIMD